MINPIVLVVGLIESHVEKVIPRSELAVLHITMAVVEAIKMENKRVTPSDMIRRIRMALVGLAADPKAPDLELSAQEKEIVNDNQIAVARATHKDSFDCKKGRFNRIPDVRWGSSESGTLTWEWTSVLTSRDSICVP